MRSAYSKKLWTVLCVRARSAGRDRRATMPVWSASGAWLSVFRCFERVIDEAQQRDARSSHSGHVVRMLSSTALVPASTVIALAAYVFALEVCLRAFAPAAEIVWRRKARVLSG
jgi:hypothetical protein